MPVYPRPCCQRLHRAFDIGNRRRRSVGEAGVDQGGYRQFAVEAVAAQPRGQQFADLGIANLCHFGDVGLPPQLGGDGDALAGAEIGVRLDQLNRDPACNRPLHRACRMRDRQRGGSGKDREEHHDRDDPRHRPGKAPLGQDAAGCAVDSRRHRPTSEDCGG